MQHAILLSRALVCVQENRALGEDETVDHIDHDNQNDSIDNLRIIGKSRHIAEDSVRLEVAPTLCSVCQKKFTLSNKELSYYKIYPSPVTCSPKCKKKLRSFTAQERAAMAQSKDLEYLYYINDKATKRPHYFKSKDYAECKRILYETGQPD